MEKTDDAETTANISEGGWGWVVVAVGFVIEFLTFGVVFSFGSYLDVVMMEFGISNTEASIVASLIYGLECCAAPIVSWLISKTNEKIISIIGCCLVSAGFISSAFAPNFIFFTICLGVVGGIGTSFAFMPSMVLLPHYFKKRRSAASAIVLSGAFVGVFVHPYLIRLLISEYAWRGTFLILGGMMLNSAAISLLLRPPKQGMDLADDNTVKNKDPHSEWKKFPKLLKNTNFVVLILANTLISLIVYIPPLYIVDWGKSLGLNEHEMTVIFSLGGIGSLAARVIIVFIGDLFSNYRMSILAVWAALSGIFTLVSANLASYAVLIAFVLQFTLLTGFIQTMLFPVVGDIVPLSQISMAFGILIACGGVAMFAGPPLIGLLGTFVLIFSATGVILIVSAAILVVDFILAKQKCY